MGFDFSEPVFAFLPFAGFLAGDEGFAGEEFFAGDLAEDRTFVPFGFVGLGLDPLGLVVGFLVPLGLLAALLD